MRVSTGRIILGTRSSALALRQAEEVMDQLNAACPEIRFQIRTIDTVGDIYAKTPINSLGVGVFVKELEEALLEGQIDIAVHSLKDMPISQGKGLAIAGITKREDVRDALVDRWGKSLDDLPEGARIGTGSRRRSVQLLDMRPDIKIVPIRGNIPTRLEKVFGSDLDGVVVAMAGLNRLSRVDHVAQVFSVDEVVPCPGQGALALEIRAGEEETEHIAASIDHFDTSISVAAERSLLANFGGGCDLPLGAYASVDKQGLTMISMWLNGTTISRSNISGSITDPIFVAKNAFKNLMGSVDIDVLNCSEEDRRY